jgi:hypothetical protein
MKKSRPRVSAAEDEIAASFAASCEKKKVRFNQKRDQIAGGGQLVRPGWHSGKATP